MDLRLKERHALLGTFCAIRMGPSLKAERAARHTAAVLASFWIHTAVRLAVSLAPFQRCSLIPLLCHLLFKANVPRSLQQRYPQPRALVTGPSITDPTALPQ